MGTTTIAPHEPQGLVAPELGEPRTGLADVVGQRLLQPAERAGRTLQVLGRSEQPPNGKPWQAQTGRWWMFFEHGVDPTAELYGGVVVPPEVREQLVELLRAGFDPDVVVVGHECPPSWQPGDPTPSLVPAPRSEAMVKAPAPSPSYLPSAEQSADMAVRTASLIGKAGFALGKGVVGLSAALVAGFIRLDPVILAGIKHEDGSITWVEVARWDW